MWRIAAVRAYSTGRRRAPRIYRYWIDVHGQLFLYDTVPKNLTSCAFMLTGFKSTQFLNFFYARVERVPGKPHGQPELPHFDAPSWTDDGEQVSALFSEHGWDGLRRRFHEQGFTWQSKCQGELNIIHVVDTPVVFRSLSEDGAPLLTRHPYVGRRLYAAIPARSAASASVRLC